MILHDAAELTRLDTFESIRDATAAGLPIVTQTEIRNDQTGLRAVIECPTKTMNISLEKKMYQVDTGPIAFPDLAQRFEVMSDCLSVAFVVFNAPHFADFIIEQPTPVVEDGQEKCQDLPLFRALQPAGQERRARAGKDVTVPFARLTACR